MTLLIRPATPSDAHMLQAILPEAYDLGGHLSYAGERDGRVVALGTVTVDKWGRYWGWFNKIEPVSPFTMHRLAKKTIQQLREVEEELRQEREAEGKSYTKSSLYAIARLAEPGSEKWLQRLGFAREEQLTHEWGPVFRCDL
jgi:hypothetical protein